MGLNGDIFRLKSTWLNIGKSKGKTKIQIVLSKYYLPKGLRKGSGLGGLLKYEMKNSLCICNYTKK